ncbi:MAG TPA: hypothetical protein VK507_02965 [Iamia sp.]|nr:hypothetical protein [Iamia sp.]
MGLVDWYRVDATERCPWCEGEIDLLQGKPDGRFLRLWAQRSRAPVDHLVDDEWSLSPEGLAAQRHPPGPIEVDGTCRAGHWLRLLAVFDDDGTWVEVDSSEERRHVDEARERDRIAEWRRQNPW